MHQMSGIAALLTLLASTTEFGLAAKQGTPLKGEQAMGGWRQDKPGVRRLLTGLAADRQ